MRAPKEVVTAGGLSPAEKNCTEGSRQGSSATLTRSDRFVDANYFGLSHLCEARVVAEDREVTGPI